MPNEWFALPDTSMQDALTASSAVMVCNRLMDARQYAQADEAMKRLLEDPRHLSELHQHLLVTDRMFNNGNVFNNINFT